METGFIPGPVERDFSALCSYRASARWRQSGRPRSHQQRRFSQNWSLVITSERPEGLRDVLSAVEHAGARKVGELVELARMGVAERYAEDRELMTFLAPTG